MLWVQQRIRRSHRRGETRPFLLFIGILFHTFFLRCVPLLTYIREMFNRPSPSSTMLCRSLVLTSFSAFLDFTSICKSSTAWGFELMTLLLAGCRGYTTRPPGRGWYSEAFCRLTIRGLGREKCTGDVNTVCVQYFVNETVDF